MCMHTCGTRQWGSQCSRKRSNQNIHQQSGAKTYHYLLAVKPSTLKCQLPFYAPAYIMADHMHRRRLGTMADRLVGAKIKCWQNNQPAAKSNNQLNDKWAKTPVAQACLLPTTKIINHHDRIMSAKIHQTPTPFNPWRRTWAQLHLTYGYF